MSSGNITLYSANKNHLNIADVLANGAKLALLTSAYTPNSLITGESVWASISANEIAAGNGYTAGGIALSGLAAVALGNNLGYQLNSNSPVWTATGGSIPNWRWGVLYVPATLWGLTTPLLGYFVGDATPADIPATTITNTLTINTPANGWFTDQ